METKYKKYLNCFLQTLAKLSCYNYDRSQKQIKSDKNALLPRREQYSKQNKRHAKHLIILAYLISLAFQLCVESSLKLRLNGKLPEKYSIITETSLVKRKRLTISLVSSHTPKN